MRWQGIGTNAAPESDMGTATRVSAASGQVTIPLRTLAQAGVALSARPYARRGVIVPEVRPRVMIVDDHALVRRALTALLGHGDAFITVVGDCPVSAVSDLAAVQQPDIILLDLDGLGSDALLVTRELVDALPGVSVLALTVRNEHECLLPLLHAGVRGIVGRDGSVRELADAISVVYSGDVYVRPAVSRALAREEEDSTAPIGGDEHRFAMLSTRERAVFALTAEGYNGPEVGARLGITAKTVDTYKQRIEDKLGLSHRSEYVRFAIRLGLLGAERPRI